MTDPSSRREPGTRRRPSPYLDLVSPRLYIFVPALMSVGFVFWLAALARDQFRRRRARSLERRTRLAGASLASLTVGQDPAPDPPLVGPEQRPVVTLATIGFIGLALYVLIGATANYLRPGGYSAEIAWILAISLILAAVFAAVGVFTGLVAYRWQSLGPRWKRLAARRALGVPSPNDEYTGPPAALTVAVFIAGGLAVLVTGLVGSSRSFLARGDEPILRAVADVEWLGSLQHVDVVGSSLFAVIAGALLGLASFRCRALVASYPLAVVGGFIINNTLKLIGRERPPGADRLDRYDSFPSGHLLQAAILAGLLPLSVAVMAHTTRPIRAVRIVAAVGVLAAAVQRVHDQEHWPTDVLGSVLIGVTIVLAVEWAIAHPAWHLRCSGCPWQPEPRSVVPRRGSVPLPMSVTRVLGLASHASAALVAILLAVLTMTKGLPSDPDGARIDQAIQQPIQLGLAGLVSVAALLSWRFARVGAVLLAIAATGLGFFAAIEYEPRAAVLMTIVILVPAVLLWLSWQSHRTPTEIVSLAVTTGVLVAGTWAAASWVNEATMGGTHPESSVASVRADRVAWLWMGALGSDSVTVLVGVGTDAESVRAVATVEGTDGGEDGARIESAMVQPDEDGVARLPLDGLDSDTDYELSIEVDDRPDEGRGSGRFSTLPDGPGNFRFLASSCARNGSNGAVFDAMAAEEADFYVNLGDLHYSNIAAADPAQFRAAYRRVLTAPAQAALYRVAPIEYVWDDHDYGPNDADATSPTREVARAVFRQFVPSHQLESPDGPIHRAFTVGRVRFVVTDTRSERTDATMLGAEQLAWLEAELVEASSTHALVVWLNPAPWVGPATPGVGDSWARYPEERQRIADVIAGAEIDNLLMISGDAHMLAYDDGTNTDYSSRGGGAGAFPLFHTAALDRAGSVKGGPYSGGTFPGGGHYGVIDIVDDGDALTVALKGKTWAGEVLIDETLVFD